MKVTYFIYTYSQQSMEHLEQLKEQLATLSDALATVSRQGEKLLQEVRTAEGRVEDLGRQVPL